MSVEPGDVGQVLKSEREKRAMTLEVVHEATKIPLDSLRAIEEGYKIRTLTTFYYKSFIKIYAQYLGLDPAAILALIPGSPPAPRKTVVDEAPKPPVTPRPPAIPSRLLKVPAATELNLFAGPSKSGVLKKVLLGAGVLLVAAVVVFIISVAIGSIRKNLAVRSELSAAKKSAPKSVKPKAAPVKTIEAAPKVATSSTKTASTTTAATKTAETSKPVVKTAVAPIAKPMEKGLAPDPTQPTKAVKKASLTVRAPVTVWLMVKVDGSAVFQGNLKKGNFESWSGSKKIEVSGKGITQLELEVNGKTIGKLGRPDNNAKKIIVTPDGMTVEK